ncbi:U7 snRNA-associated Sm-like protein LSm11 [Argiope bruennichi]|nr:U7 snRNA-associated Sm-like protein LSm11 [Argiope bruennichi]
MSSSRYDDRRYFSGSRDRSYSSRRDRDSRRRSPSPGPSRGRSPSPSDKPRDENELPTAFGRPVPSVFEKDNENVLKRMHTAFAKTPLSVLTRCVETNMKIKVWVRNANEIRGLCSGYLLAFDKHWNLCLCDVLEYYVQSKYLKEPFLCEFTDDDIRELERPILGEREGRTAEEVPSKEAVTSKRALKRAALKEKMKRRRVHKAHMKYLFIRGDSVVTFGLCDPLKEPVFFSPTEL